MSSRRSNANVSKLNVCPVAEESARKEDFCRNLALNPDGTSAWSRSNETERALNEEFSMQVRREAEFYKEIRLRELYSKLRVVARTKIGDREVYLIEGTPADGGSSERLYFDVENGLLVRKYTTAKLTLGQFPTQTDFEDFRDVEGVKVPFMIRWSIPGRSWGRKIVDVKQNLRLDDAEFNSPASNR